jgi:3-oxoacyl-[acyl-carrier protein] reductase
VLEQAAHDVAENTGAEVLGVAADVSQPGGVDAVIQAAVDRFGRLDILVNNAGRSHAAAFETLTDDDWQADLDLKVFGAIRAVRAAIPHLRSAGGGSIVNILNLGAKAPGPRSYPTSVSRAAGLALTKAMSKEFAPDRVRVNAILIGLIKSGQHERTWRNAGAAEPIEQFYEKYAQRAAVPLGRIGEASEVGDLIAFLTSPRAAYITGVAINMDGGTSAVV